MKANISVVILFILYCFNLFSQDTSKTKSIKKHIDKIQIYGLGNDVYINGNPVEIKKFKNLLIKKPNAYYEYKSGKMFLRLSPFLIIPSIAYLGFKGDESNFNTQHQGSYIVATMFTVSGLVLILSGHNKFNKTVRIYNKE